MKPDLTDHPIIDVAGWVGAYPFRRTCRASAEVVAQRARQNGITRVIVSSFDNLFCEDGLLAWEDDAAGVSGAADSAESETLELWPVVNPAKPGELATLAPLVDRFQPRGLRLLPNYHGYHLYDPCVEALMQFARERDLVVQVFHEIADQRWHWMLHVPPVDHEQFLYLTTRFTDNRLIISGHPRPDLLASRMRQHRALYVDIARLGGPLFAVEKLVIAAPQNRILFGSLHPIQITQATRWRVHEAHISDDAKRSILFENFRTLTDSSLVLQAEEL